MSSTDLFKQRASKHFDGLVSLALLLVTGTFAITIMALNYLGGRSPIELLSYLPSDQPWLPPDFARSTDVLPVIGQHFFGDLYIFYGYSNVSNPFSADYDLPVQIPPLGILIYRLLFAFGPLIATLIFGILSLALPYLAIRCLRPSLTILQTTVVYVAFVLLSAGALISLDRGGLQLIVFALAAIALAVIRKHFLIYLVLIVLAISLKPYMLLLLPFIFFRVSRKGAVLALAAVVASNLIAALAFDRNPIAIFGLMVQSQSAYLNESVIASFAISNGTSLYGALAQWLSFFLGDSGALSLLNAHTLLTFICAVVPLLLLLASLLIRTIPNWIVLVLTLATIQLVVAATGPYGSSWTFIGVALLFGLSTLEEGSHARKTFDSRIAHEGRTITLVSYCFGIIFILVSVPLPLKLGSVGESLGSIGLWRESLPPVLWLLALILTPVLFSLEYRWRLGPKLS